MAALKIICTLALVAILVIAMSKKMYNITTIMAIGVAALLIYTLVTGQSIMATSVGGENAGTFAHILDVFEFVKTSFTSAFSNPGLLIVVLVGYSAYMKEIGASEMLVTLACSPLKKIKNPYIICSIAYVIAAVIKMPITSPSGWSALMMVTMFPILTGCGVNPVSAAATIALAQGTDWGPGDMGAGICLPGMVGPEGTIQEYFLNYNLKVFIPIVLVLAVVAPIIYQAIDKKEGIVNEVSGGEIKSVKEIGVPAFYALLPLLPIVFVLLFSKIGLKTIVMSTEGCTLFSFAICILVELIRRPKEFVGTIARTASYFKSMGGAFASVVVLVASANCFSKAISVIGGFDILTSMLAKTSIPAGIIVCVIGLFGMLTVVASSSYNTAAYTWGPSLLSISNQYGINAYLNMLPIHTMLGYGRILCPINASNLLIAGTAGIDIMQSIKRNILPVAIAYAITCVMYAIL